MGDKLKKILEILCGTLSGLALFTIMVLTFLDVSGRKMLSHSITGSLELTELLMVVVIFGYFVLMLRFSEVEYREVIAEKFGEK